MQAPETIEIVEASETRVRGACLITGCPCKDSRIVSYRRAAFFAAVARGSGQTGDRVVRRGAGVADPLGFAHRLIAHIPEREQTRRVTGGSSIGRQFGCVGWPSTTKGHDSAQNG